MTYIIIAVIILAVGAALEIAAGIFTAKLLRKKEDGLVLREMAEWMFIVHCSECDHSYEMPGGRVCTYGLLVDSKVPDDFYCGYGQMTRVHIREA